MCKFYFELEHFPLSSEMQLFMDCELMFYDIVSQNDKNSA